MDIFDFLTLLGGLCLFLFGMQIMGQALERRAGSRLQTLLERMTSHKFTGLLTGLGVTAVIQSSSALNSYVKDTRPSNVPVCLFQHTRICNIGLTGTGSTQSIIALTGRKVKHFLTVLEKIFLYCHKK